jgi:hypothetical protein
MTALLMLRKKLHFWKFFNQNSCPKEFVERASLVVSVHLGTSLGYVHQVPKCHKVVHLGLDHVGVLSR